MTCVRGVLQLSDLHLLEPGDVASGLAALPCREAGFPPVKRRYSVTADVLSYRRCRRQYGFFTRRGYASAQSGQLFFGTVIHETLDRAHAHYRGELEGVERGTLPNDADIYNYFLIAERALRSRGIRPLSTESRNMAFEYVRSFNAMNGASMYPRVVDTEHRLQKDKGTYVLHGVVDVIAQAGMSPAAGSQLAWDAYEIWDYKGTRRPTRKGDLANYEFQMRVYAHLYQIRNGIMPRKAILWFLGEEDGGARQVYDVSLGESEVEAAIAVFEDTVSLIEKSIQLDDWSDIRKRDAPSAETCVACDLRWNCPAPAKPFRLRAL